MCFFELLRTPDQRAALQDGAAHRGGDVRMLDLEPMPECIALATKVKANSQMPAGIL